MVANNTSIIYFIWATIFFAERGRTFYFRVNNHPIFIKGANYVPASTLPELSADSDAG